MIIGQIGSFLYRPIGRDLAPTSRAGSPGWGISARRDVCEQHIEQAVDIVALRLYRRLEPVLA